MSFNLSQNDKISVIIPVLHESTVINNLIDHITDVASDVNHEIIIVDGDPIGDTIAAIQNGNVKKLKSDKGRAIQMNTGAKVANGDILLFLHADTRLPKNAFIKILSALNQTKYVAGAFRLGIDSSKFAYKLISYWALLRSMIVKIPYGDQAIFIRRDYFHKIGGYKAIPIMEDLELMNRIRKLRDEIRILPECIRTSARRWKKEGIVYCSLRNLLISNLYYLGIPPEKLVKFYKDNHNGKKTN